MSAAKTQRAITYSRQLNALNEYDIILSIEPDSGSLPGGHCWTMVAITWHPQRLHYGQPGGRWVWVWEAREQLKAEQ